MQLSTFSGNWFAAALSFLKAPQTVSADSLGCAIVGPSEVALRLLRWSHLSQWRLLTCEAADDTAQFCVPCFGYVEHATSRWTNSSNSM